MKAVWGILILVIFHLHRTCDAIENGYSATPDEFPSVVNIRIRDNIHTLFEKTCTGLLLEGGFVLTAAHCFHNNDKSCIAKISVGPTKVYSNLGTLEENKEDQVVLCRDIVKHEFYNNNTFKDNDVALIKLAFPVSKPRNGFISLASNISETYVGVWGIMAGYGPITQVPGSDKLKATTLNWAKVKIEKSNFCDQYYSGYDYAAHMCAKSKFSKAQQGDSGASFVYQNKTIGVLSLAGRDKQSFKLMRVPFYYEWINKTMEEYSARPSFAEEHSLTALIKRIENGSPPPCGRTGGRPQTNRDPFSGYSLTALDFEPLPKFITLSSCTTSYKERQHHDMGDLLLGFKSPSGHPVGGYGSIYSSHPSPQQSNP